MFIGWCVHTAVIGTWSAWVVGVTSWRIPRSDAAVSITVVGMADGTTDGAADSTTDGAAEDAADGAADCAITRREINKREKACRK